MSRESEIYMDFKRAKEAADQLDAIAANISKVSTGNLSTARNTLLASWECPSANAFQNKGQILQDNIMKTASTIRTIASGIRSEAKRLYEAEQKALAIASRRDS